MTTPKQRNERLLQVCRVLRGLPKGKRFDLGRWYNCGTIACAIGWSAADSWFKRRRFRLKKLTSIEGGYNTHRPAFKEKRDFEAVCVFFGLSKEHADQLFVINLSKGRARRDVIRRIEKFVRDNPA